MWSILSKCNNQVRILAQPFWQNLKVDVTQKYFKLSKLSTLSSLHEVRGRRRKEPISLFEEILEFSVAIPKEDKVFFLWKDSSLDIFGRQTCKLSSPMLLRTVDEIRNHTSKTMIRNHFYEAGLIKDAGGTRTQCQHSVCWEQPCWK